MKRGRDEQKVPEKQETPPATTVKTCDKCDGPHPTEECPHFKQAREEHKDAWVNYGKEGTCLGMGSDGGNFELQNARVVGQPGDGSCLFHSLCYGLGNINARTLRKELAKFIDDNPDFEIAGDTLEEWIRWDTNTSCEAYADRMANSNSWGGGVEMAVCSHIMRVNVHVYEQKKKAGSFKRISCFNSPTARKTIHVLYQGRMHFDALVALS